MATILFLSSIWPEPSSTAAGVRSTQLLQQLKQLGHHITLASPGKHNRFSQQAAQDFDHTQTLAINDPHTFDSLAKHPPQFCIYDRFYLEEQFSWLIRQKFPNCIHIIDTQDLHFLRQHREQLSQSGQSIETLIDSLPPLDAEASIRELASLLRADLNLIISPYEKELLQEQFSFPASKLYYLPLFYGDPPANPKKARQHCLFIGNYRHRPNLDAVHWLCQDIWPRIRQQHPHTQLHLYGSYMPAAIQQLTSEGLGIHSLGHAADQYTTLSKYQCLLAPLRFGAGLKGKILDAAHCGTPIITTAIGAEGIGDATFWQDKVANSSSDFAQLTHQLLSDPEAQIHQQKQNQNLIQQHYQQQQWQNSLQKLFEQPEALLAQRQQDPYTSILWYSQHRYTETFAQWIQAKNQSKPSP